MPYVAENNIYKISGFTDVDTRRDPRPLSPDQLSELINMVWEDNTVKTRLGSDKFKNADQWGVHKPIRIYQFKRSQDTFFYFFTILDDGRVFYIKSDDANYGVESATWTELFALNGVSSPALSSTLTRAWIVGFNNILYFSDGTQNIYYWDTTTAGIKLILDPTTYSFTVTVLIGAAAVTGATYTDGAGNTFTVTATKVAGTGLTLSVRQSGGTLRPTAPGTLTLATGSGDASIAFTAITYDKIFKAINVYSYRLWAWTDEGVGYASITNNGRDFTGAGSGFLNFDRVEGLKVSNFGPLKEGAVLTTQDEVTKRFQASILTGYKFFDPAVTGTEVGQFKVQRLNSILGIVGESFQEIGDSGIGITPRGFISLATAQNSNTEFGLTSQEFLSFPIKDIVKETNFARADQIFSCMDFLNGRYWCAVPNGEGTLQANLILVYDYIESTDQNKRWTQFVFPFNIAAMGSISGKPFISDVSGNIYECEIEGTFDDDGTAYTALVRTAAIGGQDIWTEKEFGRAAFFVYDLGEEDFEMDVIPIFDGIPRTEGMKPIVINPKIVDNRWDDINNYWDDLLRWDSGQLTETLVTLTGRTGRAVSMQMQFSTNVAGASWGLTGYAVQVTDTDESIGSGL